MVADEEHSFLAGFTEALLPSVVIHVGIQTVLCWENLPTTSLRSAIAESFHHAICLMQRLHMQQELLDI